MTHDTESPATLSAEYVRGYQRGVESRASRPVTDAEVEAGYREAPFGQGCERDDIRRILEAARAVSRPHGDIASVTSPRQWDAPDGGYVYLTDQWLVINNEYVSRQNITELRKFLDLFDV